MTDVRIALVGATGRMGRQIIQVLEESDGTLASALVSKARSGQKVGDVVGVAASEWSLGPHDVVIDFSTPAVFDVALATAVRDGRPFVSGTTGLDAQQQAALDSAAECIPVLWAANFSLGVNVLEHLVQLGAKALRGFDAEVFEAHHRHKVDAPSGTALFFGEAVARGRKQALEEVAEWTRHGAAGPRTDDEIGFQVVRGGSIVGEHTVFLCGEGERIELTHRAQDRAIFARGAVTAARWIADAEPGRYTMRDVLFG